MDSRTFEELIKAFSESPSRRGFVGGSLGAAVLAATGLDQDTSGARTQRKRGIGAEVACIQTGQRCPARKSRGTKGKTLDCNDCGQGHTVTVTNDKGTPTTRCAWKPAQVSCSDASQ